MLVIVKITQYKIRTSQYIVYCEKNAKSLFLTREKPWFDIFLENPAERSSQSNPRRQLNITTHFNIPALNCPAPLRGILSPRHAPIWLVAARVAGSSNQEGDDRNEK